MLIERDDFKRGDLVRLDDGSNLSKPKMKGRLGMVIGGSYTEGCVTIVWDGTVTPVTINVGHLVNMMGREVGV